MSELVFLVDNPRYALSRCGRVFSFNNDGSCREVKAVTNRNINGMAYRQISIWLDGRERTMKVAALMIQAFGSPKPSPKHCVCHHDGNSLNDNIDNLRWGTYAENNRDRIRHGTMPRGESVGTSKLTSAQVAEIRLPKNWDRSLRELSQEFGVSEAQISNIRRRKQWVS